MTEKIRGFEVVKGFEDLHVELPTRSTRGSAGYDFKACKSVVIPPARVNEKGHVEFPTVRVETGVKSYFPKNEYLELCNRSSNPSKRGMVLDNGVGIIDSDYYGNDGNDGHIMFEYINISGKPIHIEVGDKIGQGIFSNYELIDDDKADGVRTNGYGSTGR